MSRKEVLTRLTPKVQSFSDTGGGIGGLTQQDVAAACASADKRGELILLAKICDHRGVQEPLFYGMYRETVDIAIKQGWKQGKRGADRIRSVLQLAVYESVTQHVCPKCHGTKQYKLDPTKPCNPCRGTGRWMMSDNNKAEVTGISRQAWSKTWQHRFRDILILLETYEHKALREILKRLQ